MNIFSFLSNIYAYIAFTTWVSIFFSEISNEQLLTANIGAGDVRSHAFYLLHHHLFSIVVDSWRKKDVFFIYSVCEELNLWVVYWRDVFQDLSSLKSFQKNNHHLTVDLHDMCKIVLLDIRENSEDS